MENDRSERPRSREATPGEKRQAGSEKVNKQNANAFHDEVTNGNRPEASVDNRQEAEDKSPAQPEDRNADHHDPRTNQDEQHRVTNAGGADGAMEEQEREGV